MDTLLAERLVGAGINTVAARLFTEATECLQDARNFDAALAKFEQRVRSDRNLMREVCRAYLDARAADMRGEGTGSAASGKLPKGQHLDAAASRPNESADQKSDANTAMHGSPALSAQRNEAGQPGHADKVNPASPRLVSSRPGVSRRGMSAIAAIQPTIARSVFQTTKLPDGRTLDKVQWHELPKLAIEYRQFSRVFTLLHHKIVPPDPFMTVDQVVNEADVIEAVNQAEKFNDIA